MMHVLRVNLSMFLFLLIVVIFSIGACTSPESVHHDFFNNKSASALQWPPPPQTPRIIYLGSIKDPTYTGGKESFLKRTLNSIFGEEKTPSSMLRPYGVFADTDRVYVTDPGMGRLHVINLQQNKYVSVEGSGDEELVSPIGIAVDDRGDIYISDSVLQHVFVFDKERRYLRKFGSSDLFKRPAGLALDGNRLYVVDTHGHRVIVLSKEKGNFLFSFGKNGIENGNFNYPTNIYISNEKLIYVTDSMNFRIQIFDQDGGFRSSFGKLGDSSGNLSKPKGIAVDSEGHIYVVDSHFDNVQIFDRNGNLLLVFGSSGNGKGEFMLPAGIYIDKLDRIYVADSYNKRIQVFQYLKEKSAEIAK